MAEDIGNKARIFGVYPGYDMDSIRTYIRRLSDSTLVQEANQVEDGIEIVYTVPSGKTLYITSAYAAILNESAGIEYGLLYVRDTGDNFEYNIVEVGAGPDEFYNLYEAFITPMEIPAGYDICVYSTEADVDASGWILGYLL